MESLAIDNQWITEGKTIELSQRELKRGCFYLGAPFYLQASECGQTCHFVKGKEILVPTLDPQLEITLSTTFSKLKSFHAFQDLDPTHRFEFIHFLEGNFTPLKSNQALIEYYLRGISLRLFVDNRTTVIEKLQIFKFLISFYTSCKKYRNLIEPVLRCAFLRLFIEDNGEITFEKDDIESEELELRENLSLMFHKLFPGSYEIRCLIFPAKEYSICGIDSQNKKVVISIPDIINVKGPEFCEAITDSYITYKSKLEKLKTKEAENKRVALINKHNGCAGAHLLFGTPAEEEQSIKIVRAFYMRIIKENQYVMTSYEDIVRSFGFQCRASELGTKKYANIILSKLEEWGLTTYPDLCKINLKLSPKFKCVLFKDDSNVEIHKDQRYATLLTYIKMALYVVQEDEYNNDDINYIISIISQYAPNSRTKKELTAIMLLSLTSIQRLHYLKYEVKNIEKQLILELATTLKALAYVDGDVSKERKEQLECLLPIIGLSVRDLDLELRQLRAKIVTNVKKTEPIKITLDLSELDRLRKDTAEAQELLNEIFSEEEHATPIQTNEPPFISALRVIVTKQSWTIRDVHEICKQKGITYGALIENSNEYSYTIVDDLLLEEDGEMLYVATNYADRLRL